MADADRVTREPPPRPPRSRGERAAQIILPLALFAILLTAWEAYVALARVPPYVLPAPSAIGATLIEDWPLLSGSLVVTLRTTFLGLALAVAGGVGLAVLLSLSRAIEYALYPYAVVLQVTPVVAIAPLLLIYLDQQVAVLACAWIVAFFPVLSNTVVGLRSVDRNLVELFELYDRPSRPGTPVPLARRLQTRIRLLWLLRRPAALPYFLAGLRIAGGLALIGAVVAEIAAGSAGAGSGLAYRILESQYRLKIPRLFAALALLSAAGIAIFLALSLLSHLLLRHWHESAVAEER